MVRAVRTGAPLDERSIVVTGGGGFIGRYVVRALLDAGASVTSYDRDPARGMPHGTITRQGELYDIPRLHRVLVERGADLLVHTAAMSHPEVSIEMPVATFAANVEGTVAVFEAARMAGVREIVNFSSESVFGNHPEPVHETSPFAPTSPYAVTKVCGEYLSDVYRRLYDVRIVSLRPTEVYGPGNRMPSIVSDLLAAALGGRPLHLPDGRDHAFNLVHAQDVAQATVAAARAVGAPTLRPAYNISGGPPTTLAQLIDAVHAIVPAAELSAGPGWQEDRYRQGPYDTSLAESDLGFAPKVAFSDALAEYAADLAQQTVDS